MARKARDTERGDGRCRSLCDTLPSHYERDGANAKKRRNCCKKSDSRADKIADERQQRKVEIYEKAREAAKAKFTMNWDTMDPESQKHEVDNCVTILRNEEFGSEVCHSANRP